MLDDDYYDNDNKLMTIVVNNITFIICCFNIPLIRLIKIFHPFIGITSLLIYRPIITYFIGWIISTIYCYSIRSFSATNIN